MMNLTLKLETETTSQEYEASFTFPATPEQFTKSVTLLAELFETEQFFNRADLHPNDRTHGEKCVSLPCGLCTVTKEDENEGANQSL